MNTPYKPDTLGDTDLLAELLAFGRIKRPRATASALLAQFGSFAETLSAPQGMHEEATAYLATI
jgi:hypothetical protein